MHLPTRQLQVMTIWGVAIVHTRISIYIALNVFVGKINFEIVANERKKAGAVTRSKSVDPLLLIV